MKKPELKRIIFCELIGFGIILFAGILLILNTRLSFCQSDESFYLSLAHRLWSGDRLIIDEWHPAQFYAPILLPFYSLYRFFFPTGAGVYLYARIIYVLFAILVSLIIYTYIYRKGYVWYFSVAAAMLPLLYARANIQGPSYYNLCLQFCLLALICLDSKNKLNWVCGGLFLSLAVLCNPYLTIFVLIGLFYSLCNQAYRSTGFFVCLGILFSGTIYILCFLRGAKPAELLQALHYVLNDSEHFNLKANIDRLIRSFIECSRGGLPLVVLACVIVWCNYRFAFFKNVEIYRKIYLFIILLFMAISAAKSINSICFAISIPFSLLTLPFALEAFLSRKRDIALKIYLSGLALAVAFMLASNTGIDASTAGFCLSSIGGILFISTGSESYIEWKKEKLLHVVLCLSICILLIGTFSAHRFLGIYRDAPRGQLVQRIENGPATGLYTTVEHAEQYETIHSKIIELTQKYPEGGVLFSKNLPWAYLSTELRCADFTSWASLMSDVRLRAYFSTHSEPNLVFIFAENVGEFEASIFNDHLAMNTYNKNSLTGEFYRHVMEDGELVEDSCLMKVYRLIKR